MRDLLHALAEATGETLLAVDPERIGAEPRVSTASAPTAVALLALAGPLSPRGVRFWGREVAPGMDRFRAALNMAASDPNVAAIVIDVDSPGGTVTGTPETAAAVAAAAKVKPVIAVTETMAASAAYYIASQASEIVVAPSAEVGSIGVLAVHMDMSKMLEDFGVKATIIRSRPGKADANPYEPLTDEALAAIQASVNEADADFLKAVASGRKTTVANVRETFGQGRMVSAKEAVRLGMADRIATLPEVLSGLIRPRGMARRRSALAFA